MLRVREPEKVPRARPFLRWVGGKARLVHRLRSLVPRSALRGCYVEPFLGAGSLFFALGPQDALLGDSNRELVACMLRIRSRPDLVWRYLRYYRKLSGEAEYYKARTRFNRSSDSYAKAALFIYLNKTCFNGIWRVNRRGQFNVPYGRKDGTAFPSLSALRTASQALQKAQVRHGDFQEVLTQARAGDFVYLDPPYPPLNGTAFFCHYTKERFAPRDHERLAGAFSELSNRGVRVLLSCADLPVVRKLYRGYHVIEISTQRFVASHGRRYRVNDLAITNYDTSSGDLSVSPHSASLDRSLEGVPFA